MKAKLFLSWMFCLAIAASTMCFPAIVGSAEEAPTEISIALWEIDPNAVTERDAVYTMLQDRFNIVINAIPLTWDDYKEKVNTWVATDDMPDLFVTDDIGSKNFYMWVREELVRPMPEDMSAYPNLQKIFSLDDVKGLTVDGKFWCVPRCKADLSGFAWAPQSGCYYRKDWAQALGLEEPTTAEEFIEFVRALTQGDPDGNGVDDTIGVTSYDRNFVESYFWSSIESKPFGSWQYENGEVSVAVNAEHSYEAALTLRNMYNEGLIDPDIVIQDTDAGFNKFATNKAALLAFQMYANDHYIFDKFIANNPDVAIEDSIGYLKPLQNKYDGNYYFPNLVSYWSESYISHKVDDAKFEKILQLLDFCASEEWIDLIRFGFEGTDFVRQNDDILFLTEDGSQPNLVGKYPFLSGFKALTVWDEGRSFFEYGTKYPYSAQMINDFYDWCVSNAVPKQQSFAFTMVQTPLRETYVDESADLLAQFIYGNSGGDPTAEWDALQATLEANGLSAMVQEVAETAKSQGIIG